jgi:energy-converting hydrogenase Eha subunit F
MRLPSQQGRETISRNVGAIVIDHNNILFYFRNLYTFLEKKILFISKIYNYKIQQCIFFHVPFTRIIYHQQFQRYAHFFNTNANTNTI